MPEVPVDVSRFKCRFWPSFDTDLLANIPSFGCSNYVRYVVHHLLNPGSSFGPVLDQSLSTPLGAFHPQPRLSLTYPRCTMLEQVRTNSSSTISCTAFVLSLSLHGTRPSQLPGLPVLPGPWSNSKRISPNGTRRCIGVISLSLCLTLTLTP